jgi:hypothetical protein
LGGVFTKQWSAKHNTTAVVDHVSLNEVPARAAEKENPDMSNKIWISSALKGPGRRIAPETLMNHYVIWEFAENKEGAKQFRWT